jgi:PRC-barrel domain
MENIMKKLMLGTAMAAVLGSAATAQDMFRTKVDPVTITASDFIGKRVYASEAAVDADEYAGVQTGWNDIGEINDVILTRDGAVDAVLIDIGGFLGMGERQVALGMENVRFVADSATPEDVNDFFLVINADRTILEGAPDYMQTGAMSADTAAAADDTTNIPVVDEALGATETDPEAVAPDATAEAGPADGTMMTVDGYTAVDTAGISAEQLQGVRVYGPNDEDLGEIAEFVLDDAGAPAQVIVDVGGFLGIGEKPVAIDVTALQMMQETDGDTLRAYVQMTRQELESLPAAAM